ncbi:MAG: hypothetical protein ACFFED_09395 [Candidatus Thorarchaeota archaeon]
MKIVGQSFIDPSERFFHGMYLSAQGNPAIDPIVGLLGPYFPSIVLMFLIAVVLIGSFMYLSKRTPPVATNLPME